MAVPVYLFLQALLGKWYIVGFVNRSSVFDSQRGLYLIYKISIVSQTQPIEIVKQFAEEHHGTLVWIDDIASFAMYDNKEDYYRIIPQDEMSNIMNEYIFLNTEKSASMSTIQNSYLAFLKFNCHKRIKTIFCEDIQIENRYNYICFKDKVLNLDTFQWEDLGHDKLVFHKVPFSYEEIEKAEAPRWMQFLDEVLVLEEDQTPDKELQKLLQQMFGYCLANTIKAQKAFFLFGASRAGKGVISQVLTTIMGGLEFVSFQKLGALTNGEFSLTSLIGKKANVAGEDESSQISADTFKAIVAGDIQSTNRKFQSYVSFSPRVKLIMSANKPLKFKYVDDAIRERLITIPFFKQIPEGERDLDLVIKLHKELPGILKWALDGLKDLVANDYKFIKPASSIKAMKAIEADVSNAVRFFTENYEVDEAKQSFVTRSDMYAKYKQWCFDTGHKGVMSDITFFKELNSNEDFVNSSSRKTFENKQRKINYVKPIPGSRIDEEDF